MKALRRIKRESDQSSEDLQDNYSQHKRFITDQVAKDIENMRISSDFEQEEWLKNLRGTPRPNSPSQLLPKAFQLDEPAPPPKVKKGKRVRFDMNGEVVSTTDPVAVSQAEPRSRKGRRSWSEAGFDTESLLDQTSTEMERLMLAPGDPSQPNKKPRNSIQDISSQTSSETTPTRTVNHLSLIEPELPDLEDLNVDKLSKRFSEQNVDMQVDPVPLSEPDGDEEAVIRVADPFFRAFIARQPTEDPLQRLLRRQLEQNSMALVVYSDPKTNITLGPLLSLLDEQKKAKEDADSMAGCEETSSDTTAEPTDSMCF